ncbi:hypothetical protein BJ944DRAFT_270770 [Cunninghamella echinulata]|nr:hypothetical protein BJ944DRAFT_270770 [Cunninghamella echinulata]
MKGCIRRVLKLQHHHQHQQTKASSLSSPSTITNRNEQNDKKNSNHHNKIQSPRSTMMNGQSSFDVSYARLSYNNEIDDFTNGYID